MSIALAFVIIATLCAFDFSVILPVDTFFSSCAATLEFFAYGKLAWSKPHLKRPFRVPFVNGKCSLILFLIAPISVGLTVLYTSFFIGLEGAIMNSAGLAIGVGLYYLLKHYGFIKYKYVSKNKKQLFDHLDTSSVVPEEADSNDDDRASLLSSGSEEGEGESDDTTNRNINEGTYDPSLIARAQEALKEKIQMIPVKS